MSKRFFRIVLGACTLGTVLGCGRATSDVARPGPEPPSADQAGSRVRAAIQSVMPAAVRADWRDVAANAGVTFGYHNGARGQFHVRETMGGGVGMIDFDGDGWIDLFFTDGCDTVQDAGAERHSARLYRNQGERTFVDVSELTGVVDCEYGQGCAVGDWNCDGFDDLFVTHYGSSSLYRNNGDGTLSDVTDAATVNSPLWNTACAFGDLSGRGQLDLFVSGYLEADLTGAPACYDRRGQPAYCGPEHFAGQSYRLYQNGGDGRFFDISAGAGVVVPRSKGLAAAIWDADDDGALDIFAVNDAEPARLFRNQGSYRFEDVALRAGLAYTGDGQLYNGMGIGLGDYDGDGRIDMVVSNFYEKGVVLFRNRGSGSFRDESVLSRLGPATRPATSFGIEFLDWDNDGWLDLVVANGHIADLRADGIPYAMKAQVFHNEAGRRFSDVSAQAGAYFATERLGRGLAIGDIDNDGGSDVVVSHNTGPVALLCNDTAPRGHYLLVELIGTQSSRTPFGTRLTATVGERTLVRLLAGGGSYLSASDHRILLGLGPSDRVSVLEVEWLSGHRERWEDIPADRVLRIVEGTSQRTMKSIGPSSNWSDKEGCAQRQGGG